MKQPRTAYDDVQYPSGLYRTTHPDHLAAMARLHGLAAADPRKARVLEVAGGDGFNVLAMAAALPDARFVNIDLASSAVARGQALADVAGLANARIEVADVVEAAGSLEDEFDYVIVHGLYAWVSPPVQEATLRLIDRVLAPEGIAYISYNALPGCHLRKAVREMLLYELRGVADSADRLRHALVILEDFAKPREDDGLPQAALRKTAQLMVEKNRDSLFHDELGDVYDPKALHEIVAEAGRHDLAYLTDSQPGGLFHGLPGEPLDDAAVVRLAQLADYRDTCFFHQSLFIRPGRHPDRVADPAMLGSLLAGAPMGLRRTGRTLFEVGEGKFEVGDEVLAGFLEKVIRCAPARLSLSWAAESHDYCQALLHLANRGILELHSLPFPGAIQPGERPCANALVRAMIDRGETRLFSLDHRLIAITEEGPRWFLSLLDGSRDRAALAAEWDAAGMGSQTDVDTAIRQLAQAGMLSA
ncbi:Methyltransferase domain-containing protein [Novosphingobium sp. CF614]|uniref:methyltransferase domain-containing protein n=1 Tax=Novosphingobium sp. CF614 TaxID=1884364 RepID=UPI0008F31880|nr:methyltransferase domain-containing protein [Novosphingobium sp. CF614]SFG05334.1 Methyltransferase domain-containing protein [Novosphingobium sp. CF614]